MTRLISLSIHLSKKFSQIYLQDSISLLSKWTVVNGMGKFGIMKRKMKIVSTTFIRILHHRSEDKERVLLLNKEFNFHQKTHTNLFLHVHLLFCDV